MYRKGGKYKKRSYKRRKYNKNKVSKKVWKASKKAAKAQIYRMSETKVIHSTGYSSYITAAESQFLCALHPFYFMTNHSREAGLVGNEFDLRYFELQGSLNFDGFSTALMSDVWLRISLIRTPEYWPNDAGTPVSSTIPTSTYALPLSAEPWFSKFNSNSVKVLQTKTIRLPGAAYVGNQTSTNRIHKYKNFKIKFRKLKGKKTIMSNYDENIVAGAGRRIRQGQFYIIIHMASVNAVSGTTSTDIVRRWLDWTYSMYYKDI
ncbi:capsid protein [Faeces associated gemycircularvirus 12]|uniref:Capsid protein n=1 Tax=Faeces associated gemycircularvirus 12 TaxID=1391027 RepID=T1YQR7_9VIRU|nr:capsid protein [Faeces associated gemycircularvirus 12]AGU67646.1 capsid protein [Faeces associated gemycircularvirus 12]